MGVKSKLRLDFALFSPTVKNVLFSGQKFHLRLSRLRQKQRERERTERKRPIVNFVQELTYKGREMIRERWLWFVDIASCTEKIENR